MMATRAKARAADLHASDAYLWARSQADALRAGHLAELDLAHLAEEIEDLAIGIRSAVRSRTRRIIEHLLELEHSPAKEPRHGWRRTARTARSELRDDLTASLSRELENDLVALYSDARENAADDLRSYGGTAAAQALPAECPYSLEQIAGDWLPGGPPAGSKA
jgi:hypothetical protein